MPACPVGRQIVQGRLFFSHALILNKNPHLWMDTNSFSSRNGPFYELPGEKRGNFIKYFKISRCTGGCLIDRELVSGRGQKGPVTAQAMVSALFVNSGRVDCSGIAASCHHMDN